MRGRLRRTVPTRRVVSQTLTCAFAAWSCWGAQSSIEACANADMKSTLTGALLGLTGMTLLCYFLTAYVDPGPVQPTYAPPDVEYRSGLKRCGACCRFKPPRTHHCRTCDRCVLKMDHHCLFINACVGYRTYKVYVLCLFYAAVSMAFVLMLVGMRGLSGLDPTYCPDAAPLSSLEITLLYLNAVVTALMLGSVLWLLGWHVFLVSRNATTIEYYEAVRDRELAGEPTDRDRAYSYSFRHDIGVLQNLRAVLGRNPLLWLVPTPPEGDGTEFPVSPLYEDGADRATAHLLEAELPAVSQGRRRPGRTPSTPPASSSSSLSSPAPVEV